jgi:hypothetical protein
MRKFLAILLLLTTTSSVFGQVFIKKENRVPNREPGYCCWACLETLGRQQKIKVLYNLVDKRAKEFTWQWDENRKKWFKSSFVWTDYGSYKKFEHRAPGGVRAISNKLNSLDVKFRYQNYGNFSRSLIKQAIKNKKGCLVVVKVWDDEPLPPDVIEPAHAIVLLDYNEKGIEFYDPNDKEDIYRVNHDWFNYYFTGYVLVLEEE